MFHYMNPLTEMNQNLYTSLNELGLTESEANLYVLSLRLGSSSIASLAEHLEMPRPNVYKLIAALEKYDLASISQKKRYARTFVVKPPTVVLEKLRQKQKTVTGLEQILVGSMPDLLAQYHQGDTPTKIKVLIGEEQWYKIFFQVLDEAKDSIAYFGSADAFIHLTSWDTQNEWIRQRVKKKLHVDALLTPSDDTKKLQSTDHEEMRTTKIYHGLPFITGFMLFGNKVIIWQPEAPLAVLIEDEYIVQMLRSIFNTLWKK